MRPPSRLSRIQLLMAGAVMRPLGRSDRMRPENRATAEALIKPSKTLSPFGRLEIYNQQYWWRVLHAFGEDFPGLRAVLGQRKFDRLASTYLDESGSRSWSLRNLGQFLVRFLESHPYLVQPHSGLATDTARVEWARTVAFDGPEHPPLRKSLLFGRRPERLLIGIQPHISLLELRHPIDAMMRRLKRRTDEGASSNAVSGEGRQRVPLRISVKPSPIPIHLAVHRLNNSVYYKRLDPGAFKLLASLREGNRLGEACELAFPEPGSASTIRDLFAEWSRFGWLCER